jgi:hypothetical protein
MENKYKDMIAMGAVFVFNVVLLALSKEAADAASKANCKDASQEASTLVAIAAIGVGGSAICLFTGCSGHEITLGLLAVLTIVALVYASIIHNKCEDTRKFTTWIIVVCVLLLAAFIGLGVLTAHKKGLIKLPSKIASNLPDNYNPQQGFEYGGFKY